MDEGTYHEGIYREAIAQIYASFPGLTREELIKLVTDIEVAKSVRRLKMLPVPLLVRWTDPNYG